MFTAEGAADTARRLDIRDVYWPIKTEWRRDEMQ